MREKKHIWRKRLRGEWSCLISNNNTREYNCDKEESKLCIKHLCQALRLTFTISVTNPCTQDKPKPPCELGIIVFILQLRE